MPFRTRWRSRSRMCRGSRARCYVCPDVSGSMHSPVTGVRQGSTTAVRCIDVAALVAAAVLRKNPQAEVIPFESDVVRVDLNPRDSVMTNAQRLASLPRGGTNCSAPVAVLERPQGDRRPGDLRLGQRVVGRFAALRPLRRRCDGDHAAVGEFKRRSPAAKMICIDIQPLRAHPGAGASRISSTWAASATRSSA